jgi:hypothetical protein
MVNRTLLSQQIHQNIEGVNGQLLWNVGEEAPNNAFFSMHNSRLGFWVYMGFSDLEERFVCRRMYEGVFL